MTTQPTLHANKQDTLSNVDEKSSSFSTGSSNTIKRIMNGLDDAVVYDDTSRSYIEKHNISPRNASKFLASPLQTTLSGLRKILNKRTKTTVQRRKLQSFQRTYDEKKALNGDYDKLSYWKKPPHKDTFQIPHPIHQQALNDELQRISIQSNIMMIEKCISWLSRTEQSFDKDLTILFERGLTEFQKQLDTHFAPDTENLDRWIPSDFQHTFNKLSEEQYGPIAFNRQRMLLIMAYQHEMDKIKSWNFSLFHGSKGFDSLFIPNAPKPKDSTMQKGQRKSNNPRRNSKQQTLNKGQTGSRSKRPSKSGSKRPTRSRSNPSGN